MLNTYEQNSRRKLVATILAVVIIAGIVVVADHLKENDDSTPALAQTSQTASTSTTATPSTTTTTTNASGYKDGIYTASSDYYVPHSTESIKVSLTISSGVITSASVQNSEGDQESAQYQEDFASTYKSYVVGKKISGLQLGVIAGASDTSQGFDDALSQIATKAQA